MKWLTIFLVISLTASEKLDRTYLPPPGAQFAGGNPGDILAPLEPPNLPQPGSIPVPNRFKEPEEPSIKLPVITTSYAFTQTTTFPSIESYETTAVPINPIIGFPVQNLGQNNNLEYDQKFPNYFQQDDTYGINIQPGPLNQYQNQNIIGNEGEVLIPGSGSQQPISNSGFEQYPREQLDKDKFDQYSGLNGIDFRPTTAQENFIPQDEYSEIRSQGVSTERVPQDNTNRLPDLNNPLPPYNLSYQSLSMGNTPQQQFLPEIQSVLNPGLLREKEFKQPGENQNDGLGITPSILSSVSAYSSNSPIKYSERPQAARDRDAVILNYENVLTPNSYSYSYDTSNGIHVDESGLVGDGTKAKGSYSYTGDDGKIYSITYIADENGFQPRGDHLPTPPPIPEAIKKVIEQAARDKEAGITDDGSYDEKKYGYKNYHNPINQRRQQENELGSKHIKSNSGITNNEYDDDGFAGLNDNEKVSDSPGTQDILENMFAKDNLPVPILPASKEYNDQSNTFNFKARYPNVTDKIEGIKPSQEQDSVSQTLPIPGQASAFTNDGYSKFSNVRQDVKYRPFDDRVTEIVNNKNAKQAGQDFSEKNGNKLNSKQKDSPYFTDNSQYINDRRSNQETIQEVNENGYYYNPPENQIDNTKFATRFKAEKATSTTEPMYTTFNKITTLVPVTPEVRIGSTNRKQYSNRKSTTPRPFMTSRVTTSRGGSYSDYDTDEDQDIDDEDDTSTKQPSKVIHNSALHPLQQSQQSYMSATAIPTASYSSRFGNTETPQYTTSTFRPVSTTTTQTTPEYQSNSHYFRPSHLSPTGNGYQYQPVQSQYNVRPQVSERLDSGSTPYYYQNDNGQRPVDYSGTTNKVSISSRPKSPILSGPGTRYETTSPEYATTTVSSTQSQGSLISSGFPESQVFDTSSSGYLYGPPQLVYPATVSTIRTPSDFTIPSTKSNTLSQVFSTTTQRPTYSSAQDTYDQNTVVDGFGRPIISESQSVILSPDQKDNPFIKTQFSPEEDLRRFDGTSVGSSNLPEGDSPMYVVQQSTRYPEYNNPTKVIGENFSGPKQPQKYDPQTGYYYK